MKNHLILTALAFLLTTGLVLAEDIDVLKLTSEQQAIDRFLLLEQKAQNRALSTKTVATDCLTTTLPTAPKTPNFTTTYSRFDDSASLTFWRETCKNGTAKVLLVRVTPKIGTPFICPSDFAVVQNGNQYLVWITDGLGEAFCGNLIVSKTLVFDTYISGEQFNPANALTVYGDSKKLLDIPLKGTTMGSNISGAVNGYKNFSHTCKNTTTGAVKSFPVQTIPEFNCNGLIMKKDHKIQTTINGIAQ